MPGSSNKFIITSFIRDFGPKHRSEYKNEKKSYDSISIHGITIAGKKIYIE